MAANTLLAIHDRVTSLLASAPFEFARAQSPFDFDLQPAGGIDQVFRIDVAAGSVLGGLNFTEDRQDRLTIWIARLQTADQHDGYRLLVSDITSVRAAVIRDGLTGGGDFSVPDDGAESNIQHEAGHTYAVGRLTVPVQYEAAV